MVNKSNAMVTTPGSITTGEGVPGVFWKGKSTISQDFLIPFHNVKQHSWRAVENTRQHRYSVGLGSANGISDVTWARIQDPRTGFPLGKDLGFISLAGNVSIAVNSILEKVETTQRLFIPTASHGTGQE